MIVVERADVPNGVGALGDLAESLGWNVAYRRVEGVSISLRVAKGRRRAFAVWRLDGTSCRFHAAAGNVVPGGALPTLRAFSTFLEHPPA